MSKGVDVEVGIHPLVLRSLDGSRWTEARSVAMGEETRGIPQGNLPYQVDGIAVVAGSSWLRPFQEPLQLAASPGCRPAGLGVGAVQEPPVLTASRPEVGMDRRSPCVQQ